MANAIKGMVSKNKIRYKEDGFDLDLSYISRNIIAMGFPAEKLERFYRNHIDDVVKFFESKHKDRYKIYNLCSERKRRYDTSKFRGRVDENYSFQDHNPPPFDLLKPFCESVHTWLSQEKQNVAAIHCKAGKGRTGVMICAYLIHAGQCDIVDETGTSVKISSADKALEYYGRHRTHDSKGVTIPSQKRYVYYYEELVKKNLQYQNVTLRLNSIHLETVPIFNGGTYTLMCEIIELPKTKLNTYEIEVKRGFKSIDYVLPDELCFRGDIKIEFYIKNKIKKEKIFQFCFNTFFVKSEENEPYLSNSLGNKLNNSANGFANGGQAGSERKRFLSGPQDSKDGKEVKLILAKHQLDKAYKDKANKTFSADFKIRLLFTKQKVQPSSRSPDILRNNIEICDSFGRKSDASSDNDSENDTEDEDDDTDDTDEDERRGCLQLH